MRRFKNLDPSDNYRGFRSHLDHMDAPTLRRLGPLGALCGTAGAGRLVSAGGAPGFRSTDSRALADAVLTLTLVSTQGEALNGLGLLTQMYLAFARREHLDVEVLDERTEGELERVGR